jgi:enoyl-CoA hydratase
LSYETVLVESGGSVATVFLNRPDKRNALNATLRAELIDALESLREDREVRVVVLAGAGESAFAAGADVAEFAARSVEEQRRLTFVRRLYEAVAEYPKPTIAAVHGFCLGGGAELALACDLRVAARSAKFGQAEIRIGLIPGGGATQRLTRLVGYGQALRIALTGDMIDGEEAHRIGLVEFLAEDGGHLEMAREVGARIARWSGLALHLVKKAVRTSMEASLAAGLEVERELFLAAFGSEDGREGVRAFVESRRPEFGGL